MAVLFHMISKVVGHHDLTFYMKTIYIHLRYPENEMCLTLLMAQLACPYCFKTPVSLKLEQLIFQDIWFSRLVLKTKRLVMLNALEILSLDFKTTYQFLG